LLVVGGPRFDPAMVAELGVDRVFGKGTTPAEVASYLVHEVLPARRDGMSEQSRPAGASDKSALSAVVGPRSCTGATSRHRTPHYGGQLVDGAYVLALFGDVATERLHPVRRRRGPVSPRTTASTSLHR